MKKFLPNSEYGAVSQILHHEHYEISHLLEVLTVGTQQADEWPIPSKDERASQPTTSTVGKAVSIMSLRLTLSIFSSSKEMFGVSPQARSNLYLHLGHSLLTSKSEVGCEALSPLEELEIFRNYGNRMQAT